MELIGSICSHAALLNSSCNCIAGYDGPTIPSTLSYVARGRHARLVFQENVRNQPDELWDWPTHRLYRLDTAPGHVGYLVCDRIKNKQTHSSLLKSLM